MQDVYDRDKLRRLPILIAILLCLANSLRRQGRQPLTMNRGVSLKAGYSTRTVKHFIAVPEAEGWLADRFPANTSAEASRICPTFLCSPMGTASLS
jgi:hypothetical protein